MSEQNNIMIRIPTSLKKQLQIIAIQEDTNMTEIILQLIQNYIDEYNTKK